MDLATDEDIIELASLSTAVIISYPQLKTAIK